MSTWVQSTDGIPHINLHFDTEYMQGCRGGEKNMPSLSRILPSMSENTARWHSSWGLEFL